MVSGAGADCGCAGVARRSRCLRGGLGGVGGLSRCGRRRIRRWARCRCGRCSRRCWRVICGRCITVACAGCLSLHAVVDVLANAVEVEGRRHGEEGAEQQQPRVSQHVCRGGLGVQEREGAEVVAVPGGSSYPGDAFHSGVRASMRHNGGSRAASVSAVSSRKVLCIARVGRQKSSRKTSEWADAGHRAWQWE